MFDYNSTPLTLTHTHTHTLAGSFGKVMLARKKDDKKVFAIKILKKSMVLEKDELVHTLTENSVLAKCQHPFLTRL